MDVHTLLIASVSSRTGFIVIFLLACFISDSPMAFRFWTASLLASSLSLLLIYTDPDNPYFQAQKGWLIYTVIGISISCVWAGALNLFGQKVSMVGLAVMSLVPGLVYGLTRFAGFPPDLVVLLTVVILSITTAIAARIFFVNKRGRFSHSQLLIGTVLGIYSLALVSTFFLLIVRILSPDTAVSAAARTQEISLSLFVDQLISVLIYVGLLATSLEDAQMQLKAMALTDPLTKLTNRRGLQEQTNALIGHARRSKTPIAVLMVDIDHFKQINDCYGHESGDAVLQEFARRFSCHLQRQGDVSARWGGEEFVAVIPDMKIEDAIEFAQQICQRTSEEVFDIGLHKINVTVSIGVASIDGQDSLENAVSKADEALYAAKRAGRNRVESFHNLSAEVS